MLTQRNLNLQGEKVFVCLMVTRDRQMSVQGKE